MNTPSEMCAYWLPAINFALDGAPIPYRPVGHHAMNIVLPPGDPTIGILGVCIAEASLLDRLASLVSAYYIFVGIFAGISKAAGPCMEDKSLEDWPYIPLLFIWTLPVIYIRIRKGRVVDRMPGVLGGRIPVAIPSPVIINTRRAHTAITALASVALPCRIFLPEQISDKEHAQDHDSSYCSHRFPTIFVLNFKPFLHNLSTDENVSVLLVPEARTHHIVYNRIPLTLPHTWVKWSQRPFPART
ncbi:10644_t:CDS:2, partial [Racocetra fulgida]